MNCFRAFKLKLHTSDEPNKRDGNRPPGAALPNKNLPSSLSEGGSPKIDSPRFPSNDNDQQATTNRHCAENTPKIRVDYMDQFFPQTHIPLRGGRSEIVVEEPMETVPTIAGVSESLFLADGLSSVENTKPQHKYPWLTPPHSETSLEDQDRVLDVSLSPKAERGISKGFPSPPQTGHEATDENEKLDGEEAVKSEGNFNCNYCKRSFSYLCHLKVHERVHTGEKPYSCKYCSQQFSQLGSLTVHMRIHTGAKPYQCSKCSKKFRHVNSLRRHQRQVHNTKEHMEIKADKTSEKQSAPKQYVFHTVIYEEKPNCPSPAKKKKESPKQKGINSRFGLHDNSHVADKGDRYWPSASGPVEANAVTFDERGVKYHHASKFIRALEEKNETGGSRRNFGSADAVAAETLMSLSMQSNNTKTWRPFSTDDEIQMPQQNRLTEDKEVSRTEQYSKIKEEVIRQSWSSLGLTCSGNVLTNTDQRYEPIICDFAGFAESVNSSRRYGSNGLSGGIGVCGDTQLGGTSGLCVRNSMDDAFRNIKAAGLRSYFNGQYFWPSALSLQCPLAPMTPYVPKQLKEEREPGNKQNESGIDLNPNTSDSEESAISMDGGVAKDGNSSDEGFSSSCSNAGKRRCSDSSVEENGDSGSARRLESSPNSAVKTSNVRETTKVQKREVFATEERAFDRKWSEDSGFGVYGKNRLKVEA